MTVETEGQYGVFTPISVGVGTSALNSEGLEKAFDILWAATEWNDGWHACRETVGAAIAAYLDALPPVDGLEVVGHVKPDHPEVVDPLFVRELSQPWMDGIFTEPLVTLSQASSIIAGLTAEIDDLRDEWQAEYDTRLAANTARRAAEARISSLEEENKRLREALEAAKVWHEAEDKALSKQPPSSGPNGNGWARLQHQEQIRELETALLTTLGDHNG